MKLIFWHNMVSIHQSSLIKACSLAHEVVLVVPQLMEANRIGDGWTPPSLGSARLILAPDDNEIEQLILDNHIHVFCGIDAYPMVFTAFRKAILYKKQVLVYAEPYDYRGFKGILRYWKYRYLAFRYGAYISAFLATGDNGLICYKRCGFAPARLFEWAYYTEQTHVTIKDNEETDVKLLFVGQLIERKAILQLICAFKQLVVSHNISLTIIGNGVQHDLVCQEISDCPEVHYLGALPNEKIHDYIKCSDLLDLPSYHDGWGAVINEALQDGCRVLCSTACGAASLLDGKMRGGTFDWKIEGDLFKKLLYWVAKGPLTLHERLAIRKWAEEAISGTAAASYLEQIIDYTKNNKNRPVPPWKRKN